MPRANIERAIKRGTGELAGEAYEAMVYEAIAPGGVFIFMEILTDNRNRTASEIRRLLEKGVATMGSCAWAFEQKGVVTVRGEGVSEEELLDAVLELGAEDMTSEGEGFQIVTVPTDLARIRDVLREKGYPVASAELSQEPTTLVGVDDETARKVLGLLESLEEHDDVQNLYSNIDIPEEMAAELAAE
jgi:YebC/PmpR family DNA-binding regulatory protein